MTDIKTLLDLLLRFSYNFLTVFVIIRCIYFRKGKRDFLFTFFLFNLLIFFVCSFLRSMMLDLGFAFGLFAIFTILRYRTETIPIREMTYQFIVITLAAINGLPQSGTWYPELILVNLIVLTFTFILDGDMIIDDELSRTIEYEKIELIKPDQRDAMVADLRERTGLDIQHIRIESINFLRDTAKVTVYYKGGKDD